MKTITRIHGLSLANMFGLMYLLLGIIGGLFFLIIKIIGGEGGVPFGMFLLGSAFVILYTIFGWIIGYLCAFIYNIIAKHFGGVRFDVE